MRDGHMGMSPEPELVPLPRLAKKDMHDAGLCVPCLFFASKKDGCRKGDACSHCHFCTKQEAAARRRKLRAQSRQNAKAEAEQDAKALQDAQVLTNKLYWL
ncbi:unnamed protein product [Effrenium voratum]|nr:unnamed protein product [Effrenium voratum]